MLTVSVPLTDKSPVTAAEAAEQVGTSVTPDGGVTVQVNTTLPVNPSLGATVTVEAALEPGDVMLTGVAASAKPCDPGPMPLVTETVVDEASYTESPEYWTVSMFAPGKRASLLKAKTPDEISPPTAARLTCAIS